MNLNRSIRNRSGYFLSAHKATKKLGISSDTLRRWHRQGKVAVKASPSGTRLYNISSLFPELASQNADTTTTTTASVTKKGYLYARVSSAKQKEDLERQKQLLLAQFPTYELISDIGSGINFKRPGLKTLLERSSCGAVSEVAITHRDRLCRFAFDLLSHIFSLNATKLVVLFDKSTSDEHEFAEDILAINTVFICRMQGRRAARHRRERQNRREAQEKINSSSSHTQENRKYSQSHTINQSISELPPKAALEAVDGLGEICL
jgi:predicted site-specific integrase-resolvase